MFDLPRYSGWDALHPVISHFPIALLLVAPFCLAAAIALRKHRTALAVTALGLSLAGTFGVYLAAATGDAARDAARAAALQSQELKAALATHEDLGSAARAAFSVLTAALAALLAAPPLLKRELPARRLVAGLALLLVLYLGAGLALVNTAHSGGLLVHRLGVHAPIR